MTSVPYLEWLYAAALRNEMVESMPWVNHRINLTGESKTLGGLAVQLSGGRDITPRA
jgi:hypothetical protein